MENHKVYIAKGTDAYKVTLKVLNKLDLDIKKLKSKAILLKPNAGRMVGPHLGINTAPEVVGAVIDFFIDAGLKDNISVGESPIMGVKALESLKISGIADMARKRKIPLIDLDADGFVQVSIKKGTVINKLKICRTVLESDYIVSIPVMKTHMHTGVSLGLKNMKGCLYKKEKVRLHQLPPLKSDYKNAKSLDMAVADMSTVLMPDLTVIDGSIGQEGMGPSGGEPKKFNIILASESCLAADIIAVDLMKVKPIKAIHLKLAMEKQGMKPGSIKPFPSDYMKWAVSFRPPPEKISFKYASVKIEDKDSCSACLSTLVMFLQRYYKDFADYFSESDPLRIALGKGIDKQPDGSLLIGNCTFKQKNNNNVYVKGCPPVASQIREELNKILKTKAQK